MRKFLLRLAFEYLNRVFNYFGLKLLIDSSEHDQALCTQILTAQSTIDDAYSALSFGTSCIIFSKDRPAQLDLLLRSMVKFVTGISEIIVLYRSSNEDVLAGYEIVTCTSYKMKGIRYVKETNFQMDLLNLLAELKTRHLMCLVDDIVFLSSIDLVKIEKLLLPKVHIFSPRLGRNTIRCYTRNSRQRIPTFSPFSGNMLAWLWESGEHDFSYPLSLDGHLYIVPEFLAMVKLLKFKAPNSLEIQLQAFLPLFKHRLGVCHEQSILVNVPHNRVQNEVKNRAETTDSGAEILQRWLAGEQVSLESFTKIVPVGAHESISFHWAPR